MHNTAIFSLSVAYIISELLILLLVDREDRATAMLFNIFPWMIITAAAIYFLA